MSERYEVEVRPDVCTGAQMCVSIDPDTFSFDRDRGVSRAHSPVDADDDVLEAAEMCPVEAILVRDADSGAQLRP